MNTSLPSNHRNGLRRAFTLIEILIVISLTAIVFALLLIPLVSALNYTRSAQALTAAQDAARTTRERITRELSSALYVFDNTSHPFTVNSATVGEDRYTNFLDLQILDNAANPVVAHAYNAKLDFVLPKVNDSGTAVDPTTGEPIKYSQTTGSAVITSPSLVFPAAAGTTMIRYFVGLKDPTLSYNNVHEGQQVSGENDNTYILYRAQFQPYKKNASGVYVANTDLFQTKTDSSGKIVPEFDDPDFFRYVTAGTDTNWLDDTHGTYPVQDASNVAGTPGSPAQHNNRVDRWRQIAKAVIPGPNVDLILLPHASNGKLIYDDATGPFPNVAHTGSAHDPVGNKNYPVIGTSVTFRPGTVSGNATPATTSSYTSQAVIGGTDQNNFTYIPTVYTTTNQSWTQPYKVTLTPPTAPSGQSAGGRTYTTGQDAASGDYYEYPNATQISPAVLDISSGKALNSSVSYIPLTINADSGTINFAAPAVPDPASPYQRQWVYAPVTDPENAQHFMVDMKQPDSGSHASPLGTIVDPTYKDAAGNSIPTARIVPGSLRVYGPDATAGPGQGQPVLYTEASGIATATDNQYTVDYAASRVHLSGNTVQNGGATQFGPAAMQTVTIIYDYQANMAPVGTVDSVTGKMQAGYTMQPMSAAVDYQTRDLIDVSIGVRIFDISTGVAQIIPSETKVKIGNSNR